jgi:hypothetical protein
MDDPRYIYGMSMMGGQPSGPKSGASTCAVILFVLLGFLLLWYLWQPRTKSPTNTFGASAKDTRCGIPEVNKPTAHLTDAELRDHASQVFVTSPIPNASSGITNSIGRVPFTPNLGSNSIPDEMMGTRAMAGGTPYQPGAFSPSEATAEFYSTFQPSSLSSMMPANWRSTAQNCGAVSAASAGASAVDTDFDEFSRYTVSPSQVQKAETMRGTIRLSEMTSSRNARTLGEPSLLRNAVTPTGPIPTGSAQFIFNDSSVRQGYIAAATGRYPTDISC